MPFYFATQISLKGIFISFIVIVVLIAIAGSVIAVKYSGPKTQITQQTKEKEKKEPTWKKVIKKVAQ